MRVEHAVNIADLGRLARRRLPRLVFDDIDGGPEDEIGLAENLAAPKRCRGSSAKLRRAAKLRLSLKRSE